MNTFFIAVQIFYLLLALILIIYLLNTVLSFRKLVPYVPTPYKIIKKMIRLADIKPADKIIDLGSGSGRIILEIAKKFPNQITGIDNSPILIFITRWRFWLHKIFGRLKTKNYQIIKTDFLNYDLSQETLIFCFLTNQAMEKLAANFENLPGGSKIISYHFHLNSDKFRQQRIDIKGRTKIYIYVKLAS